jgi:hypothetical protein
MELTSMMRRGVLSVLTCIAINTLLPLHVSAQSTELVVIELNSRSADEVVPLLRPMLAPGGSISGLKDKLIIRTTQENLTELRSMLDIIDARPRRLLITVRQDREAMSGRREIGVSGSIGNDDVRITLPDTSVSATTGSAAQSQSERNSVRLRANSAGANTSGQVSQTVQVLEGGTAFIGVGESFPIGERSTVSGTAGSKTIGFQETISGFYVVPRIQGNRVSVQLATAADTVIDRQSGAAYIQRITTVVSGRIGDWIEVGGVAESSDQRQSDIASERRGVSSGHKRVFIKVEEID